MLKQLEPYYWELLGGYMLAHASLMLYLLRCG